MSSIINRGPWILTVARKTRVVFAESVYDGGMVQFYDAVTHEPAGSCGIHWWLEAGHKVLYHGSLPELPEEGKWL